MSPSVARANAGFTVIESARLVGHPKNDGDSFFVEHDGQTWQFRLYFVDAAEISTDTDAMVRRVRSQTRHFGLSDPLVAIRYGQAAARFIQEHLSQPFTVHTVFARTMGTGDPPRHYAFVTTAAGEDLAALLVWNGLARAFGVGRETPDGTPRDEHKAFLEDLETAAALARRGIWSEANADRLAELRRQERQETRELQSIRIAVTQHDPDNEGLLNINTAPLEALVRLPGIGRAGAARIVAARPLRDWDALAAVKGVGPKIIDGLKGRVAFVE